MKSNKPNRYADHSAQYQAGFVRWFSANKARFTVPVEMSGVTNPPADCSRRYIRLTFPTLPGCLQIEMIIGPGHQFIVHAVVEWNGSQVYLQDFEELFRQRTAWGFTYEVRSLDLICNPLLRWVNEALAPATAIRLRSEGGYTRLGWSAILVHGAVAAQPTDLYDIPLQGDSVKYMLAKRQYPIPHELIVAVQGAGHVVVLTGAGLSAESGISILQDSVAQPAQRCPRLTLLTQNADNLQERPGSADVLHLHVPLTEDEFQQAIAVAKTCDVLFVVGTSCPEDRLSQIPAAAAEAGAFVAQIAMQKADTLPMAHRCVYGSAERLMPLLVQAAFPKCAWSSSRSSIQ